MKFEKSIVIKASAEQIFHFYETVSTWSQWDPEVQYSTIEGEFKKGVVGKLKPKKGPEAKIEISEVIRHESFTAVSRLPLCLMKFEHKLIPRDSETKVVHSVVFSGPLSFLFGKLIGSGIKNGLPATLEGLKRIAELKN